MKQFESKLHQKLNTFADWFLRVTVINIMMIICALPIVTLYPALLAGYKMFNDYLNKKEVPIFKGFWNYFKENFAQKMKLGFILAAVIILAVINLTVYSDYLAVSSSPINLIGYYVMLIFVVGGLFITFYTFPLMITYPKTDIWLLIKFAFFLSGKYILRTILAVAILFIPILMLLTPITMFIFIFAGASLPVILYALLFKKVIIFVEGLAKDNV